MLSKILKQQNLNRGSKLYWPLAIHVKNNISMYMGVNYTSYTLFQDNV